MPEQKPTKKDFVDLLNSVMGKEVMTENQLTRFLNEAKHVNDTQGTQGVLEYIQQVTNAPASKDQLSKLAKKIKQTGDPGVAIDFLKDEKLLSDHQARQLNRAIDPSARKKRNK